MSVEVRGDVRPTQDVRSARAHRPQQGVSICGTSGLVNKMLNVADKQRTERTNLATYFNVVCDNAFVAVCFVFTIQVYDSAAKER